MKIPIETSASYLVLHTSTLHFLSSQVICVDIYFSVWKWTFAILHISQVVSNVSTVPKKHNVNVWMTWCRTASVVLVRKNIITRQLDQCALDKTWLLHVGGHQFIYSTPFSEQDHIEYGNAIQACKNCCWSEMHGSRIAQHSKINQSAECRLEINLRFLQMVIIWLQWTK